MSDKPKVDNSETYYSKGGTFAPPEPIKTKSVMKKIILFS